MKNSGQHLVERCTCLAVRRAARAVGHRYDAELRETGLTNGQFSLLVQLKLRPGRTVSAMGERLILDRTTLLRNLELLRDRELVDIAPGANDARTRVVSLTESGERTLGLSAAPWRRIQDRVGAVLGPSNLKRVLSAAQSWTGELAPADHPGRLDAAPGSDTSAGLVAPEDLSVMRSQRCIATTVRRSSRAISASFDEALRPASLLCSQLHLIAAIDAAPGARLGSFVDALTLDQSTLTRLMQRLRREGLASVIAGGPERRGIVLTDAGKSALAHAFPHWLEAQQRIEAADTGATDFNALMRRLAAAVAAA